MTAPSVASRITAYLCSGGLWNPELANHEVVRDLLIDCRDEIDALRAEVEALREPAPSWAQQGADILAAAVDDAIRRGALDARSLIADCRLDYGRPFSPQEVAQHLDKRRHETNAARKP